MPATVAVHWLKENAVERSPHRVLVVDTETRPVGELDRNHQVLRLWSARLSRRHGIDPKQPRAEWFRGTTAGELAELVDRLARSDHALWLFTHNLNFDLAVTALPVALVERGWRMTDGALTTDSPWCRMARGTRRLAVADSWSYLPSSVETLGELTGLPKLELPEWADDDDAWWARCDRDVDIVAQALDSLMEWWDAGRYGNWSITGPSTGWNSYRHRLGRRQILVDPDPVARELEARAITGGRRDVWRLGRMPRGLYADLDMATAHLVVMSERPLPVRRLRRFESMALDDHHLEAARMDVLAECELDTQVPRYPWDSGHGVFYPVGRFRTVLAGPEIREARRRGELRAIGPGYVYVLADHMTDWARWVASLLAVESPGVPPAVRLMAKHWSRCVPGKWAGHTSEVIDRTPDPRPGWHVEHGWVSAGRRRADYLRIGGETWTIVRDMWADDAFPAILAWIQAHTRVAVNRLLDALGPAALSVNTDGVLVDVRTLQGEGTDWWTPRPRPAREALRLLADWCTAADPVVAPFTVRVKGAWDRLKVVSPQHAILGTERRLSGIPKRATALGGGRYRFTQWPKLRVQLQREGATGYTTRQSTADLSHVPPPGWLWADGTVTPVTCHLDDAGDVRIELPSLPGLELTDLAPALMQHPRLRGLLPV